jgi:hypothetical protein
LRRVPHKAEYQGQSDARAESEIEEDSDIFVMVNGVHLEMIDPGRKVDD